MKFIIRRSLIGGRYYVKAELIELTETDKEKSSKFGFPLLQIKYSNGKDIPTRIVQINNLDSYGFYNQNEADEYADLLKNQIQLIKSEWEKLEDNWSKEEEL